MLPKKAKVVDFIKEIRIPWWIKLIAWAGEEVTVQIIKRIVKKK